MAKQLVWVRSSGSIKTMIESFESLTWTRRYRSMGVLEMRVNRNVDGAQFLVDSLGDEISIVDDPTAVEPDLTYVIEELVLRGGTPGASEDVIELTAVEAGLLNYRIALPPPHHGPLGAVVNFDGVDALMDAAPVFDGVGDFTIEYWVRSTTTTFGRLAGQLEDNTDTLNTGWYVCSLGGDGTLRLAVDDGASGGLEGVATVQAYNDGEWHHAAFQRDGDTLRINVDYDAEIVTEDAIANTGDVANADNRFRVGGEINSGFFFDGDIGDVRVWGDVRTQAEIRDNRYRRLQGNEDDLLGYWRMDDGEGSTVSEAGGDDGTLNGGFSWTTFGPSHHSSDVDVETAMRNVVRVNTGPDAVPERRYPNFVLATNQNRGVVRDWKARFETLAEKLRTWSEIADDIGWEVHYDAANNQHVFTVLQGADVSAKVQFSITLDNVHTQEWRRAGQDQATLAYVAGEKEGGSREFTSAWNDSFTQGKARREIFVDARDLDNVADLGPRGEEKLAERNIDESLEMEVSPTNPFVYRRDWDLGDVVTLAFTTWDISKKKRIVEIQSTLDLNTGVTRRHLVFGRTLKQFGERLTDLIGNQGTPRQ